jgi:5-methylcytosine-specific restriction endonuclease McrA
MSNFENSLVMSVDFVLPRARKGQTNSDNLVAACRACNLIKGHGVFKSLEEAKTYVLGRRSELHREWESRMARLQKQSATASR